MGKKTILLFNALPREEEKIEQAHLHPPLSLLVIAAPLEIEKEKYNVVIIDETIEPHYEEKLSAVLNEDLLCVAVTAITGAQIRRGLIFSKQIKKYNRSIPIMWGGYHPTILPEQTVANEYVDVVIRGRGEETFKELVEHFYENKPIDSIAGITFKKDNTIMSTPDRPFNDINKNLPTPYHLIDLNKYIYDGSALGLGKKLLGIRTSQGCPWACGFCAEVTVTKRIWSAFSAERVVEEIAYLNEKYGVDTVLVYDTNFFVNQERVKNIFKGLLERKLDVSFAFLNARADQVLRFDKEMMDLFKQVKVSDFLMGAEAGSDQLLAFINKKSTVSDLLKAKTLLKENNITASLSFMVGLPIPEKMNISADEEFKILINNIKAIQDIDDNNNIKIFVYTPYPGTPLFSYAVERGLKAPSTLEEWSTWGNTNVNEAAVWIPKKYEQIVDVLTWYVLPYTSIQFSKSWELHYKGKFKFLKRNFHKSLRFLAKWRLQHEYFGFPIDYKMLIFLRRMKVRFHNLKTSKNIHVALIFTLLRNIKKNINAALMKLPSKTE